VNGTGPAASFSLLGPMIVANKDTPVRVKFINSLPTGSGGNLFLPVDTTMQGAGAGPTGGSYTQNRATLHLHGGATPWISDGTEHQWITPANETTSYPRGVSVRQVPDMSAPLAPTGTAKNAGCDAANSGCTTFYYTNQQSARLMWYHDHSYGITRLNVYAGEAAPYVLRDSTEQALINNSTIPGKNPGDEIPLVIQDKTFVPGPGQLAAEDPTWDTPKWGGLGNLWLPHVYMTNQNPSDIQGVNAMGRWDYGPWFWPPFTGITHAAVPNPLYNPITAPTENKQNPGTPNPTITPEGFMDTPVVNGEAYPYLKVGPHAYRFRVLNGSNDRTLNLQIYKAASPTGAMWSGHTLLDGNAGEVNMTAAVSNTTGTGLTGTPGAYPSDITDGRAGGVPDLTTAGPSMLQIGNEGGLLPQAVTLPNTPVGYDYNRRNITVLNVTTKTLFLGPAERADIVVDFTGIAPGTNLILYNDAPAPVPAFDPRYDYYTGDPDQTSTGGAPTTVPGYGPNTRTIMQFQVDGTKTGGGPVSPTLPAAVSTAYGQTQPKPLVPISGTGTGTLATPGPYQNAYNAAFGTNYPIDSYARVQDTSHAFFNGALTSLTLTNAGTGYTSAPDVRITGNGTGATATASVTPSFIGVNLTNGGFGYTTAPAVAFSGGGTPTTPAAATASLTGIVQSIRVISGGSGYTSAPTVVFTNRGGSGATARATVAAGVVTGVTVTNAGTGYASSPTVQFVGGGGRNASAIATITRVVISVTITNKGAGYSFAPTVSFTGGGGSGATGTVTFQPGAVSSLTLTNGGTGYTSAPTVAIGTVTSGGGSGATADPVGLNMTLQPKSIIENFDADYGRMNSLLGVEVPNTTGLNQTSIPYGNIDPVTEVLKGTTDAAAPIGSAADGTQIWKITHNGVDTHSIHWHMFDVQLLNRVGWDGQVKPPDPNELGWKDTVRMNPLEDVIVALRPIVPNVPWPLPNSIRLMDPTMPAGSTLGFSGIDPTNQPAPVTNQLVNFGWEYIWHCHLLGHEENDMMRPMAVAVAPRSPTGLTAAAGTRSATLRWSDTSVNETAWIIERATSSGGPWVKVTTLQSTTGPATGATVTFTNTGLTSRTTYFYRVTATNVVGDTQTYAAPSAGYPTMAADSTPSGAGTVTPF
jgi:FtsP/CotA-like multicopper oxidase with cupredoxin domain